MEGLYHSTQDGINGVGATTSYLIYSTYAPLPFIECTHGVTSRWVKTDQIAATLWRIVVASIEGNTLSLSKPIRYIPRVHCFARLSFTAPVGGWGLVVKDAAGNRAWDSRENMLQVRTMLEWTKGVWNDGNAHQESVPLPGGMQRPAHCGFGSGMGESITGSGAMRRSIFHRAGFYYYSNADFRRTMMSDSWEYSDVPVRPIGVTYEKETSIIIDIVDYI